MHRRNRWMAAFLAAALLTGTWVTPLMAQGNTETDFFAEESMSYDADVGESDRDTTAAEEVIDGKTSAEDVTLEEETLQEPTTEEDFSDESMAIEETGLEETTETVNEAETSIKDVSVSSFLTEDGISWEKYWEFLEEAKQKLKEESSRKDMYALIYLADSYEVKKEPSGDSETVATLFSADTVRVAGMDVKMEETTQYYEKLPDVWYCVEFYVGDTLCSGYVEERHLAYSDEILLAWKAEYEELFLGSAQSSVYSVKTAGVYEDVLQFPVSYQGYLNQLKNAYPNWTFVPMNTGRDFSSCVQEQQGSSGGQYYSWISASAPAEYRAEQINSSWYHASYAGIAYYMDPRNFLSDTTIFQFEQNTYNASYHSEAALQQFLSTTFMKGKLEDDSSKTYSSVIFNSGKNRGLSPFNLAARVVQEQGVNGTSPMISGKYSGFEGYYNYYNISASGTTNEAVYKSGLTYAKKMGWNTRQKSLEGGAEFLGNGYILKGQDTLYLQKFDLNKKSGSLHQYMQNIQAAYSEGISMRKMYVNAQTLSSAFVFKIPVFTNMPGVEYTISPASAKMERETTKTITIKGNGVKVDPKYFTFTSSDSKVATVDANGVITAVDKGTATITASGDSNVDGVTLICKVEVVISLKSISLNESEYVLYRGDTADADHPMALDLQVSYTPEDTTDDKTVTFSSSNTKAAKVARNENDVSRATVTAAGIGSAKITAKVGNLTAACNITVKAPMQSASLDKKTLELFEGGKEKLTVSYMPVDTTDDTDVIWESEDQSVAIVEDGTVRAISPGTTKIHAKVGPFDGTQEELICTVTVKQCHVEFHDENGGILYEEYLSYGKTLGAITSDIPWEMTDQTDAFFAGWYTQADGLGVRVTKETVVYGNMILYPDYQINNRGFFVKPIGDMVYTGSAIKPVVEVYDKKTLLILNKDYTVSYKNNTKVNDASVEKTAPQIIVKGKGSYSGTQTVIFKILPKEITQDDIAADDLLAKYTGKVQKPAPVVKRNGKTLRRNTDYTVTYPKEKESGAYLNAGSYPIVINGINGYCGSRTIHIKITNKNLISKVSVTTIKGQTYTGNAVTPSLTLRYAGKTLTENQDYMAQYSNNIEIGTAQILITGMGDYIGSRVVTFKINGTSISKAKITGIVSKEYTGDPITQDYTITDTQNNPLIEGIHYRLEYSKNINAGTATMTFYGIGSYSGTVKKTFRITPYNIKTNLQMYEQEGAFHNDGSDITATYEKGGVKPKVTLSYKGNILEEKVDYTLSYKNHTAVNDGSNEKKIPTITIKGKGNFTGTVTKEFKIQEADISDVTASSSDAVYKNRKNAWKVTPVLTDQNGKRLTAGTDYDRNFVYTYAEDVKLADGTERHAGETVQPEDIPTPGELNDAKITVTVTGVKNYKGEVSATYRIIPLSITSASVKIPKQTWIGTDIPVELSKEDITVTLSGQKLLPEDFEIVSYTQNTVKGTAKVTIKGVGNYGGSKTVSYTIAAKPIVWWKDIVY